MDNKELYWHMVILNIVDAIGVSEFLDANIDQQYAMLRKAMTIDCSSIEEYDENIKAICKFLNY